MCSNLSAAIYSNLSAAVDSNLPTAICSNLFTATCSNLSPATYGHVVACKRRVDLHHIAYATSRSDFTSQTRTTTFHLVLNCSSMSSINDAHGRVSVHDDYEFQMIPDKAFDASRHISNKAKAKSSCTQYQFISNTQKNKPHAELEVVLDLSDSSENSLSSMADTLLKAKVSALQIPVQDRTVSCSRNSDDEINA